MDFVLAQDLAVGFHSRGMTVAVMTGCGDSVLVRGILVNPSFLQPVSRICVIGGNQVKTLRVNSWRMAERLYLARHQKVERLNLVNICFSFIERFKGPHDGGARNRYTAHCRLMFKILGLSWQC